jgi:peptidyl-prolyl cis-trans isomerase D
VPSSAITAAFRTPKDGVGQSGAGSEWTVFKVTDVTVPPVDMASDEVKRLQDSLQRGLAEEQVAQYVNKIEQVIGTTINQAAFAQVTGANN